MYEWAQQVRVLHYNILEKLAREKQSNLLGPLESYKENAVCFEHGIHKTSNNNLMVILKAGGALMKQF
jgi:hypothetical protein